ncbi:unnamed protein product, partial [Chrysoparadoxa australica]
MLLKDAMGKDPKHKGSLNYVLGEANKFLTGTLGMILRTIPEGKDWYVKDQYYLVSKLAAPPAGKPMDLASPIEHAARGLLMLLLGLIYCHPDKMLPEDILFRQLHQVDGRIQVLNMEDIGRKKKPGMQQIEGLGEIHHLLDLFAKQHYTKKVKKED